MKEAFWGVLIILLGLFGIVVVNLFQNVTVDNDRVYYLIKESTEASAYDSIDLTYYRLSGNIRIVEDKFVENLTRRFAQNVTIGDYTVVVQDINEVPPKISLFVRSGITSFGTGAVDLENKVNAVIEAKYKLEDVLEFFCGVEPDVTASVEEREKYESCKKNIEDGLNKKTVNTTKDEKTGQNICSVNLDYDDAECLSGDIKFTGFGASGIKSAICQDETIQPVVERTATYKTCECGKWSEEKKETVSARAVKSGNAYVYTWNFKKDGELRNLNETIVGITKIEVCTTDIKIYTPKNIDTLMPKNNPNEQSSDNSNYTICPADGIRIPLNTQVTLHPGYIPVNAVNRSLTWKSSDSSIVSIVSSNPSRWCVLNSKSTNCFSKAIITAKKVGNSTITTTTTRNQSATCLIKVWDGTIDTLSGCSNATIDYNGSKQLTYNYTPKNSTNMDISWSVSDTSVASINSSGKITAKNSSSSAKTVTVTITENKTGKTASCKININGKPSPPSGGGGGSSSGGGGGDCSCTGKKTYTYECWDPITRQKNTCTKEYTVTEGGSTGCTGTTRRCKTASFTCDYVYRSPLCGYKPTVPKPGCFLEKTKVLTKDGYKYIDEIEIGDIVLSYNEISKKNEYGKVVNTYIYEDKLDELYTLVINNKELKVTSTHPFYVKRENRYNYVEASNLKVGDIVLDASGKNQVIENITHSLESNTVYNIEVDGNHNYYVGEQSVLVHNKGGGCFLKGTNVITKDGYKNIDEVRIGDIVLSYNEVTGKNEYNKVLNTYIHEDLEDELYTLVMNNKELKVTGSHRFYIDNNWVEASNLKLGDKVMYSDGTYHEITKIDHETQNNTVYNIEVENNHNYYVGEGILVHNRKIMQ